MAGLDDLKEDVRRQKQAQKKAENRNRMIGKNLNRTFLKLSPMVESILGELGNIQAGKFFLFSLNTKLKNLVIIGSLVGGKK